MANSLTSFSSPGRKGPTLSGWERGHRTLPSLLSGLQFTTAASLPFSQGNPRQLDQVSHAGGKEDGLLIAVPSLIITLYLFHHELGMSQERILSESIQAEHRRRNSGLEEKNRNFLGIIKNCSNKSEEQVMLILDMSFPAISILHVNRCESQTMKNLNLVPRSY